MSIRPAFHNWKDELSDQQSELVAPARVSGRRSAETRTLDEIEAKQKWRRSFSTYLLTVNLD